jgi:ribosomal protection tetracycline resistance protein
LARTLNLGILAHVDAGKTTLTERLLYDAGVIAEIGSVDKGSTQTDSLALERRRGITIKSAVVSFAIGDVTVNLIDTPGHPDFIAEVERVLGVLDAAVLVISAVEGVQPQTRLLMRTLRRLRTPTLLFVNKIDRGGAQDVPLLRSIAGKLTPSVISMGAASGLGTRSAAFMPYSVQDTAFADRLVDLLADHDDALLAAYVEDEGVSGERLFAALAALTGRAIVHPVYFGSAITGAGVDCLAEAIGRLLPSTMGHADGPLSGTVFKTERGPAGEKVAYVRLFSGTLRTRDRLRLGQEKAKVTAIQVFNRGSAAPGEALAAGQIGKVWGLGGVRIGDPIGAPAASATQHFAPPTLEAVVEPREIAERAALHAALAQLAEQDPLINVRQDDLRHEITVSLYGEVQKEVIQATLAAEFGVDVSFRETTTVCIERPTGSGAAVELMGHEGNPFRATVGLRIEPAAIGSGVRFELGIERGALPVVFIKAVEDTVRTTLRQGISGWDVTDCTVTLTHSGYVPPPPYGWSKFSSSAGDFRHLTPLVVMHALVRAGTRVFEPIHHFHLETPADTLGATLRLLARLGAVPYAPAVNGSWCTLDGDIPAARMHRLQQQIAGPTRGEGVMEFAFDRYEAVAGSVPTRPRTDFNPLDRKEYLLHTAGRL